MQRPCVYILASKRFGTLYVGVTTNLARRIWEHKNGRADGFTKTHGVHRLVYVESHDNIEDAIVREKRIKRWRRSWKDNLIQSMNPEWNDLFDDLLG